VVRALVEEQRRLRGETAVLREQLRERSRAVRSLEGQLLEANQRRQDVAKRIDDLISQIAQLDQHFSNQEP
jgi:septal ring factor EnvC (AmiA/AmiB activator)